MSEAGPWLFLEDGRKRWVDFNPAEKSAVVKHYGPKIKYLALRLKAKLPKHVELGDMISSGSLGLMEALGKFNPALNIKFETYAENRIKGAMLDDLRRMDWFSRGLRHRVKLLDEAKKRIERQHNRKATEEELAAETGLSEKDVRYGLEAMHNQLCVDLDAVQETLSTDNRAHLSGEPYQSAAMQEIVDKVAGLIEDLTPREKMVMSLYYGDELNMRETAEVMGVTEGRVSQLHTQAMGRLKSRFQALYGLEGAV